MTISILKAERFYPLGKPIQRPAKDDSKKDGEQVRPGIWRKPDGTLETRGYETPPAPAKPAESSLPATPNALAGADGWIEWAGGECPISHVKAREWMRRNRNGDEYVDTLYDAIESSCWCHQVQTSADIVAYCLIPQEGA